MSDLGREGVGQERKLTMPPKRSTPKMLHRAAELRKQTTPAEKKLWASLRLMREDGIHFRRQYAIDSFIADFCAPRKKLVIELDGSQHLAQKEYDEVRTKYLELQGYRVLRFWNNDVMNNIDDVLNVIWIMLHQEKRDEETRVSGL
jgi:very-short-patch-repair endonuclease